MGRMAIDLKKNKELLLKAYNDVVSDSSKANWVIFGYEGLTPVLKVVESGDGGIEELSEELNSGKIQYAYCRITDPNTALPKYVLINWQGEGAQDSFKLKCTAHLRDIQAFLKTVHVSINARTEADIDEDDIVKQVAKASGANYSFHKEKSKAYEAPGPVGTDYHRVIPTKDINTKSRDQFWADTEKEELKRQQEEVKRQQEANQKADQERKEREEKQQKDVHRDDEECRYRADQMRRERAAEVVAITSSASNARNYFQQKSVERPDAEIRKGPPPPRKLKSLFSADQQKPQEPIQREPIQLPKSEAAADFHVAADEPEPSPQSPTYQPELSTYQPESSTYLPKSLSYEPHYESETTAADAEISQTRNLLQQNVPASYKSTELEEEQNWNEPLLEDISPVHHEEQVTQRHQQQSHDRIAGGGDQGLCARALYDYQAADDTEISFDPNDIITNIDKIDEGWWQGFAPDGSYGMFPSNFVEIITE